MNEHPTKAELRSFLREGRYAKNQGQSTRIVFHLLAKCSSCQENLDTHLSSRIDDDYSTAFSRAEKALADFFAVGRASEYLPEELWCELKPFTQEERAREITCNQRFADPGLVGYLVDLSHAARYQDPEEMLHLADLARLAADACTAESVGSEARLSDLKTRAWGHFGNSLRVRSQLPEAQEAIAIAMQYLETGTGDPPVRARLLEQRASLCTFQGCYSEAIELAEEASSIYQEIGQTHNAASSLVHKAIACLYAGETEHAIGVLNRALPLIDPENSQLLLAACHNLVYAYITLDRPEQALSLYFEARPLYKGFEDELILLRVGWQEGQLLRDLGHLRASEAALLQARKGFLERDLAQEVALVSLDLAWVYAKLGLAEEPPADRLRGRAHLPRPARRTRGPGGPAAAPPRGGTGAAGGRVDPPAQQPPRAPPGFQVKPFRRLRGNPGRRDRSRRPFDFTPYLQFSICHFFQLLSARDNSLHCKILRHR